MAAVVKSRLGAAVDVVLMSVAVAVVEAVAVDVSTSTLPMHWQHWFGNTRPHPLAPFTHVAPALS